MEAQADLYQLRLAATPAVEEKLNELVVKRNNLYLLNTDLQSRMMEAQVAKEFESKQKGERFTLVESARLPEKPHKPNRIAIILIGVVLGLGAGVGFASIMEFSDASFQSAERLSRAVGHAVPVLAEIPLIITPADKQRKTVKKVLVFASVILVIAISIYVFDQYIMYLDVFQAKLQRKLL